MIGTRSTASRGAVLRRSFATGTVAVAIAALTACSSAASTDSSTGDAGDALDTITPGVLTVAIQPYEPYTSMKDGKMVGLDADILTAAAEQIGLTVEPQVTDFNGMLGGVQSRRVDVAIGGIAWTAERANAGLFTDPAYYSPPAMAVHGDKTYTTLSDLENLNLGTVTGYVWTKSIAAVPGAKLSTFPDANGLFADIAADRVDVGFVDPLIISYTQQERPDLGLTTQYLTPPTDEEVAASPDLQYFQPYMTGFYLPKESPKLTKALSDAIDEMYANGELATLITKYGGDPAQYLTPAASMTAERTAVDRDADWTAPSAG